MRSLARSEAIALLGLCVAVITCLAALAVVPEVRAFFSISIEGPSVQPPLLPLSGRTDWRSPAATSAGRESGEASATLKSAGDSPPAGSEHIASARPRISRPQKDVSIDQVPVPGTDALAAPLSEALPDLEPRNVRKVIFSDQLEFNRAVSGGGITEFFEVGTGIYLLTREIVVVVTIPESAVPFYDLWRACEQKVSAKCLELGRTHVAQGNRRLAQGAFSTACSLGLVEGCLEKRKLTNRSYDKSD